METKLSKEKLEYFKKKLEDRKKELEKALTYVARKNPANPEDWETVEPDMNVMVSDKNELADIFEELENRAAIGDKLEERLNLVKDALERIEKKTYGVCETEGEMIDEKRLEVFPSAKNCIKHAKKYK
ncbi:hypothetical protein KJ763_02085 [Patescibacteria group bacterium]|nr:hypothetical protein [Patescibacteria group bacterium]